MKHRLRLTVLGQALLVLRYALLCAWDKLRDALHGVHGCADCGGPLHTNKGPRGGWTLEDGRRVCHACCVADLGRIVWMVRAGAFDDPPTPRGRAVPDTESDQTRVDYTT